MKRLLSFLLLLSAPALAMAADPQSIPGFGGAGQVARVFAVLLLMVGAILGLAALARRHGGLQRRLPGVIKVVSVTPIGTRERLLLVEVGGQQLLVGATPGRLQTLLVLGEPVATHSSVPATGQGQPAPGFAAQLRQALGRGQEGSQ